jgi:hypothetical protein
MQGNTIEKVAEKRISATNGQNEGFGSVDGVVFNPKYVNRGHSGKVFRRKLDNMD